MKLSSIMKKGDLRLFRHFLGVLWTCLPAHGWIPFAEHALMNGGGGGNPLSAHNGGAGMNPYDPGAGNMAPGGGDYAGSGTNPFASFMPPYQSFRNSGTSIGSICYCDVRINKMGTPGDLLFKLHYPTINAQNCQVAIQQCGAACKTQATRQLTGNVLFEEGGLENLTPEKEVSVGTVLCKEHNKVISPPGVVASVFAKPDACGRATPIYDLTGEETRLCCTLIAHPYIRTEHILVFSPECIAGVAPPTAATTAAPAAAAGANAPAQAPEPVPYNQAPPVPMPQFRHYDPMNAMMLNAFG